MVIAARDIILLTHAGFGVLGCMSAMWVFVDTLNARVKNAARIQAAALLTSVCMAAAWILGGYWYVHFYPLEKALILQGPWPFAHNVFMETKEHLFFVAGILALFLPHRDPGKVVCEPSRAQTSIVSRIDDRADRIGRRRRWRRRGARSQDPAFAWRLVNSVTSGFALAAVITILFSTALACTKDMFVSLNSVMKALTGHHWTTHGVIDLALFTALGLLFAKTRLADKIDPMRLGPVVTGGVVIAGLGLGIWYLFV